MVKFVMKSIVYEINLIYQYISLNQDSEVLREVVNKVTNSSFIPILDLAIA
jgi:hypothetical protein